MEDTMENLLIPLTPSEVTTEWLSKALKLKVEEGTITVETGVQAGVGFLSNMLRVKFSTKEESGNHHHSIILKLIPPKNIEKEYDDFDARNVIISDKMDKIELVAYQTLLPAMWKEIPSIETYICQFLYGRIQEEDPERNLDYSSVVVLKDLKSEGYCTKPFTTHQISQEEIELVLDFLAKMHAASIFHELRRERRMPELYDCFPEWYYPNYDSTRTFSIHTLFCNGFKFVRQALEKYGGENGGEIAEAARKLIREQIDPLEPHGKDVINFLLEVGQRHPCLVHGDLWQNNALFLEASGEVHIKIIDWQLIGYSDPTLDLAIFILTAVSQEDLTKEKIKQYVSMYYEIFQKMYSTQGIDIPKKRAIRSFDELWESFSTFGVAFLVQVIIQSGEILLKSPLMMPKWFRIIKFLHFEMDVTTFLKKGIVKNDK